MISLAHVLQYKYPGTEWTVTGNDYNSLQWADTNQIPKPSHEDLLSYWDEVDLLYRWDVVRARRNALLTQCDWTQIPDSPLSAEVKTAWATYRQALRDITAQPVIPEQVTWPMTP